MKRPSSAISECLTDEELRLLTACYGAGQRLYVPQTTACAPHLEIILGLAATSRLIHTLGGCYVYLPGLKRPDGNRREPSLVLVKQLSKTMSAPEIARRFHVSVRTIFHKRTEIRRREAAGVSLTARQHRKTNSHKNARAKRDRLQNRVSLRRSLQERLTDD
jgi:hypothetical protein